MNENKVTSPLALSFSPPYVAKSDGPAEVTIPINGSYSQVTSSSAKGGINNDAIGPVTNTISTNTITNTYHYGTDGEITRLNNERNKKLFFTRDGDLNSLNNNDTTKNNFENYLVAVNSLPSTLVDCNNAFKNCINLTDVSSITTLPPGVKTLRGTFSGCTNFDQALTWDISNITDMTDIFNNTKMVQKTLIVPPETEKAFLSNSPTTYGDSATYSYNSFDITLINWANQYSDWVKQGKPGSAPLATTNTVGSNDETYFYSNITVPKSKLTYKTPYNTGETALAYIDFTLSGWTFINCELYGSGS
jgi:hypothetical protein